MSTGAELRAWAPSSFRMVDAAWRAVWRVRRRPAVSDQSIGRVYSSKVTGTSLAGLKGCGLRPPQLEHGNGADSGSLACVPGKARVAPRLPGVDAVAFSTGKFADGHLVCLGSAFGTAVTGGGQVAVPVGVGGCSCLGGEDVDDVRLGVVREVHHRGDVLPPACAAAVMHQDQRGALEVPADPALVRPELRDGLRVPVERVAHVELLSFTVPGYALGPGDGRPGGRSRRL